MSWGIIERDTEIHVIPCDKNGYILSDHKVDNLCKCRPEVVDGETNKKLIVIHNEYH